MGNLNEKETVTLETLLRLKRSERPADDFWDAFENDFHRRRLNSLVEKKPLRSSFLNPFFKAVAVGMPALLITGLAFFWIQSPEVSTSNPGTANAIAFAENDPSASDMKREEIPGSKLTALAINEGPLVSQFVVDAIQNETDRPVNFRKVLYTPAIHLSAPNGAFYVKDSLSSRNYSVTTADLKLGRNF